MAFNKNIVGSNGNVSAIPTDENLDTASYFDGGAGLAYITVDLQDLYLVNQIMVWHYYSDLRIYANNKIEISADGTNWTTVFDSEVTGRYVETASGRTFSFPFTKIRYIKSSINGSNVNTGNHWCEIKVLGYPK